jgi:hypothetical protein
VGADCPSIVASDAAYGGQATIHFVNQHFTAAGAWSSGVIGKPLTIVNVGHDDGGSPNQAFFAGLSDMLWSTSPQLLFYNGAGNAPVANPAPVFGVGAVIMFEDDGTVAADASKLFVNDLTTPAATSTTAWGAAGPRAGLDIGRGTAGVSDASGPRAEFMAYDGILSPTDKANLRAYLTTTHPYGIAVTS